MFINGEVNLPWVGRSVCIYPQQKKKRVEILRQGGTHLILAITQKLYKSDTHSFFGFGCYGDLYCALDLPRNQEAKVFSLEGDLVVTFHDTLETVGELQNLAAEHESYSCQHFVR